MKNITVSVDDETYRRARVKAAESATSVSALVRRFLSEPASAESDVERLKHEERDLRARIVAFTAGNRVSRQDAHGRGASSVAWSAASTK
jgi:plasmid stability protein